MAADVLRDPTGAGASARERALAEIARQLTETPWTVDARDLARLSEAGLRDDEIVQAVSIAAVFNHLTRVADATGVEPDYDSPLDRLTVDASRAPAPRPPEAEWPWPAVRLSPALCPGIAASIATWRAYVFTASAGLSLRDRAVVARTTAHHVCDRAGSADAGALPATMRERALAAFAEKLTVTPWRMTEGDLAPLRAQGLDDRGILDVIAVVGFQNMESRMRLGLGAAA